MKCYAMRRPQHRLSTKAKKKLQRDVNDYVKLSIIFGHDKALEVLKQRKESEVEGG